jgi:hypothetical protein
MFKVLSTTTVDINSIVGLLRRMVVGNVSDVSKMHVTLIIRVEVLGWCVDVPPPPTIYVALCVGSGLATG